MLRLKALIFAALFLLALGFAGSERALSNSPQIQISAGDPIALDTIQLEAPDWSLRSQELAEQWVRQQVSHERVTRPATAASIGKLVVQIMDFTREISRRTEKFQTYYRAQFLRAISREAPGFAWVLVAERTGYETPGFEGVRYAGAMGVQLPILGSSGLWLNGHETQLALRLMPLAANYEKVSIGANRATRERDPDSGVTVRPVVELEGSMRVGAVRPGFRFLVQPELPEATHARLVGEVYVEIDVSTGGRLFNKISIVPRCIVSAGFGSGFTNSETHLPQFAPGYAALDNLELCSVSAAFKLGM